MIICEGIFFVLGIIIIITGRFKLSRGRTVTGERARLAGLALAIPGPLALLIGLVVGAMYANDSLILRNSLGTIAVVEFLLLIGGLIVAILIGITAPESSIAAPTLQAMPDILTLSEAAKYMRVTEKDLLDMIATGRLYAVAIGDDFRISKESLRNAFHL